MLGIVSIEDGDASVADVSGDFADNGDCRFVAVAGFGEQGAGGFGVGHIGRAGNHGAIGDERIVNGGGGAVAFKAADVAAIAGAAVDVNGDVSDFGGGTEEAVDEATVVDDAEAHAFADQIIGEVVVGVHRRVEEIMCEGAGAGVLFDEHWHAESGGEFVDEVDFAPALHVGHHGGAAYVTQIGAGHCHADGHDGWVVVEQLFDALVDGDDGVVDGVVAHRGQVFKAQGVAAQVEHADLHQRAGEFDADDAEVRGVELESDGTAVLGAFQIAGLFNHAGLDKACGDFGDGRGGEFQCLGDLRAGADAVVIQVLNDAGAIGFGDTGLRSGVGGVCCHRS